MTDPAPRIPFRIRANVGGMSDFGRVRERRTRKGSVRWYIDARPYGRIYARRDALGEQHFTSKAEADRLLERIRSRIDDGMEPAIAVAKLMPRSAVTVARRAEAWLAEQRRRADAGEITRISVDVMTSHVKRHWTAWEGMPVTDVRKADIARWQSELAEGGLSPGTVRNVSGYFAAFLCWLYDREEIDRLPGFPSVTVPDYTPQIMAPETQELVLAAIPEAERGIFLACVDLALRPSEARALRFAAFEMADGVPWVTIREAYKGPMVYDRVGGTKTGKVRGMPCSDRLWAWVQAHANRFGPAFVYEGGPWSAWRLNRVWQAACERAGVPVGPVRESTRHSTATAWRAEHGIERVQEALGHSEQSTTKRYGKFKPSLLVPLVRR